MIGNPYQIILSDNMQRRWIDFIPTSNLSHSSTI
jgi:hypothetical protein